jgi:rSAM/selenodomain-associated transferase 1
MPEEKLIVFAKTPRAGSVKTRLAASIGQVAACDAYRHLVDLLLRRIERLENVDLRISPDDGANEALPWLRKTWRSLPQGTGDLGERLQRGFAAAFAENAQRVVVIGSDCPSVKPEDIEAAWLALKETDLVLGPSTDGGYWLIGLRTSQPSLFEGISWSSDRVLQETLARTKAAGLRVHLLRELTDVDAEPQWREFLARQLDS